MSARKDGSVLYQSVVSQSGTKTPLPPKQNLKWPKERVIFLTGDTKKSWGGDKGKIQVAYVDFFRNGPEAIVIHGLRRSQRPKLVFCKMESKPSGVQHQGKKVEISENRLSHNHGIIATFKKRNNFNWGA